MLTKNISFSNFRIKYLNKKILGLFKKLLKEENEIIESLKSSYVDTYTKKEIKKLNKFNEVILIGMGGSILGSRSIYSFLKEKIKKKFIFKDDFEFLKLNKKNKKNRMNLIISKSGNTLETISNANVLINKSDKNISITENRESYLSTLAEKLKFEVIHHNNFIGGRYSVLSEVGMLPAQLMGLNVNKFRRFNSLIKNKKFVNSLIQNVSNTLYLIKRKKYNSIILNYDENSSDIFYWYQQLIAESLGKKSKGILPIISNMPKDNHSLMQLYLDGFKSNFYTFFNIKNNFSEKINSKNLLKSHIFLKKKSLNNIKQLQFNATEKVFRLKKIPFRSFLIKRRNEEALGELFIFFILETILLGKALNVNPYDQPAVELIKTETKKFLKKTNYR
ncbi:MAG: glucose-6-phosphate isomerase [Candidatus Pelagibacter sp.]